MEAFNFAPPDWTANAIHARQFCCPTCQNLAQKAKSVWLNRRSPVYGEDLRLKWQEFYDCECGTAWWGWSSERPPSKFANRGQVE